MMGILGRNSFVKFSSETLRPKWVFHNFGLKMIALFFAIFVWVYIQGELGFNVTKYFGRLNDIRKIDQVAIHWLKSPDLLYEVHLQPQTVSVSLSGREEHLQNVLSTDILLYVDLHDVTSPGIYKLPVQIMQMPKDVKVVMDLPVIDVSIEPVSSKQETLSPLNFDGISVP